MKAVITVYHGNEMESINQKGTGCCHTKRCPTRGTVVSGWGVKKIKLVQNICAVLKEKRHTESIVKKGVSDRCVY